MATESYKSFTLNTAGGSPPWGTVENTLIKDIIATMVTGTCTAAKDTTNGHRHYVLHYSDGSAAAATANASGNIGIGIASADSRLHLWSATAGTVTAKTGTLLTLEGSANHYVNFLAPATATEVGLLFGDPDDNDVGQLYYDLANNEMDFVVNAALKVTINATDLKLASGITLQFGAAATWGTASVAGTIPAKDSAGATIYICITSSAAT